MRSIQTFVVIPLLPEKLQPLKEIAFNMWWCWDHDSLDLFRRLDPELWENCQHNPVKMLGLVPQDRMNEAAADKGVLAHMNRVLKRMESYQTEPRWFQSLSNGTSAEAEKNRIAYFSAEFGLSECLPIYSGGLGILAGDHLKSASDLAVPLVGVGLLYRQGYFQQYLNADGWQQESYPDNDFYNMPVKLMLHEDGRPIRYHVELADRDVVVQVWKVQVGRVDLYLLDTNLRCNRIEDRQITAQLYGGDNEMRVRQEILLGIGGIRALQSMGIEPAVCHMNEGHAAFLSLERIRLAMEQYKMNFHQAREATVCGNVFTTHTPVPAGHDVFSAATMEKYFSKYVRQLGVSWQDFLGLGRTHPEDLNEPFSMTVLALRLSTFRNGVSQLHGAVSRQLCGGVWSNVPTDEVPITSITNGIHVKSWISHEMNDLLDRYLGPDWSDQINRNEVFGKVDKIPDEELWRTHARRRERLVAFARRRLHENLIRRGGTKMELSIADEVLDPEALTIGFARRFATYKRGTLLFHDLERFAKIISSKDRPVQVIFAGKAHPRDTEGKAFIRQLIHFVREEPFSHRVVFLENYDINVARYLVQGVDVWLNTPRRGMEASGTSGMKVLSNGGLNLSILDGWWCEGALGDTGWSIGHGESYDDQSYQDEVESHAIYDLLEKEVIPLFYTRGSDRLPRGWIRMMKNSMRKLTPQFSTSRMVAEYTQGFYLPSLRRWKEFNENNRELACGLADWKESVRDRWNEVAVLKADMVSHGELQVGGKLEVRCQVRLGSITPGDVSVELYYGPLDSAGEVIKGEAIPMECKGTPDGDQHVFTGMIPCRYSGLCGFAVRVIPNHPSLSDKYDTGKICWYQMTPDGELKMAGKTS